VRNIWQLSSSAALALISFRMCTAEPKWPSVSSVFVQQDYRADTNNQDFPFSLAIKDGSGVAVYKLECHSGEYESQTEMNFSGTFHCALFAIKGDRRASWNLLATAERAEQQSDWNNRGRMISDQLWADCAHYEEYGEIRHFKLRAMVITFRFSQVEWFPFEQFDRHKLRSFIFSVSVLPDASIDSEQAEPVVNKRPPRSCGW